MYSTGITDEQILINTFKKYLIKNGFPEECILTEWPNNSIQRYDIVVLDKSLSMPLLICELKNKKNNTTIRGGVNFLKKSFNILGVDIKYFMVFPSTQEPFFESYDITSALYGERRDAFKNFESYKRLPTVEMYELKQRTSNASINISQVIEKREKLSLLKKICWYFFPTIAIVLIVLDFFTSFKLTTSRLVVYGVLALIVFLPFVQQIGFGEYSLKMKNEERKKDDESTKE